MCPALTVSVEVPWPPEVRVSDELLSEVFGPGVGETVTEKVMVPENPFRLVRDIVEPVDEPLETAIDDGLAVMLKSPGTFETTLTVTVVAWESEPLVAVIVTV